MSSSCPGFKAHGINPTRCKRCFKEYNDHVNVKKSDDEETKSKDNSTAKQMNNDDSRTFQRSLSSPSTPQKDEQIRFKLRSRINDGPSSLGTESSGVHSRLRPTDTSKSFDGSESQRSAGSISPSGSKKIKIIDAKEIEEVNMKSADNDTNSSDVQFILRVKTARENVDDEKNITAEATLTPGARDRNRSSYGDRSSYGHSNHELTKVIRDLELKINNLEKDKTELMNKLKKFDSKSGASTGSTTSPTAMKSLEAELQRLKTKLKQLETINNELKMENNQLKGQQKGDFGDSKELKETILNLKMKLNESESLCEELKEENEQIKKEVQTLEDEFQELHDNYREDQASEFRILKRELESTAKNMRILQFKLKKSERTVELLENDKLTLEKKLQDLEETTKMDVDKMKMKELETQLSIAKEVSLNLHAEIESLRDERSILERQLNEKNSSTTNHDTASIKKMSRLSAGSISPSISFESKEKDYETVIRDLYDTMEREKDLQEQLKFSEEESRTMRKKLSTIEQENEILMMQIRKMANRKIGTQDESTDSDELTPEEMKLHLELYEQEVIVLRKKTDELEQENENFQTEIKYLQDKLISQPLTRVEVPEIPEGSPPNVIYEHKIRLLEAEARDLRKKLIDKEKDNESLRTELDVHRRKASASKAVVRTRSLDSEQQVDLKRQLQLVEQEAQILRQKIVALESDNEKLSQENKRFQLRLSRKPPPGPVDQMQIENMQLKEELNELKQKCDSFKCDIINNKSSSSSPASTPASSSKVQLFRWNSNDSMNQTENDLIISLKKQLKSKEEESTTLKSRLTKLELELTKSNRDYKKLKDTLCQAKKFMPKVIRETATRMELKDIIKELENEICLLHNQLKAKDLVVENNQEEVEEVKKSNDNLIMEMKNKEAQFDLQMEKLINENIQLKKDFDNEKSKLKSLQTKLDLIKDDKQSVGGLNQFDRLEVLQAEKKELALKCDDLESNLKSQIDLVNELQDKLKSITKLRDELMNNSKLLQTDKEKLEDEIDEYKDKFGKSDKEMKLLNEQLDKVIKENKKLLKDNAALKKEIEQEKLKLASVQQGQQGLTTAEKENTELKRQIQELILKIDKQTKQFDQEKLVFVENEKKLRNEMTKRIDDAIKDERKELQFELQSLKEECSTHRAKVNELNDELDKARSQCRELQDKLKQQQIQFKREKDDLQLKINDFEGKIKNEQRKREKLEKEYEIQIQGKEKDVTESKEKQLQIERENRRLISQFEAHEFEAKQKISSLEKELTREKENYDEMTSKYDLLEKDFVDMKSRLIKEKEVLVEAIETIKKSYDQKLIEIKSLKETLQNRQEIWFKEKFNFQAKIQEQENKLEKFCLTETEKNRFKGMLSEKESLLESYRREEKHIKEERDKLRRKCDELTNKISEMERLERASRTLSITGKSQLEKDLQDTKIKLDHSEVSHKAETAALHAEYEGRMQLMSNEMNELQLQIAKLAKESEYYKMRFNQQSSESSSRRNSLTNSKYKDAVEDMTVQILALKEQLEGVLMENRNLKIQHGADRTTWQVQMAELKTKINQLEEQNLIETTRGSGARSYIKTKMELAWEKERQEQQKLLQDTQKFIQDLRDKLLGIEILRDKERQEARRQFNELKFVMDREHEEAQKQITELQLDLIEMKDVQVKIRSQNERLIRQSPLRTGVLAPHPSDPRAPPRARSLNKKSISLDQQLGQSGLRGASEERIWESDADSARTTPASSYTNLGISFVGVGYGSRRMNSGYDSETSSFGKGSIGESDASAPAGTTTKVKKSIKEKLKSLKKTHSIEETTTGSALADAGLKSLALHPSPFELASSVKGKKKKDSSIKSMITKTLSKTFKSQSEQQLAHPSDDKSFSSAQRLLIGDRNAYRISPSKLESSYSRPLITSTSSSSNTKSSTLTRIRPSETTV